MTVNSKKKYASVETYLASQPEKTKQALLALRKCILQAVPNAIEMINYNIPAYALTAGGKRDRQIFIAGHKNHVGLYPHPTVIEHFQDELKDFNKGKGSVQFPLDTALPLGLIKRMIEYRMKLISKNKA